MRGRLATVLCCLTGAALPPAGAATPAVPPPANPCDAGPTTANLVATATRLGVIDLHFFGALGAPVDYVECDAGRAIALGHRASEPGTPTPMWSATRWRCTRLIRRFAATATLPDGSLARGTSSIRTRSCAQRFELEVPRRVAPGHVARVGIRDGWRVGGVRTSLCVTRPGGRPACRDVIFRTGAARTRRFRLATRGLWSVELRVPGHRTRASIAVGVRGAARKSPPPTLLATGDSTMDGIDSFLADDLGDAANVVSEVELGLAISKADGLQPLAVKQVARVRPTTTVVSIGANEGFAMRAADGAMHACCDAPWVDEFARRVRRTMVTYPRRVFWLTIAAPRDERRAPVTAAVNTAIVRAAEDLARVHVLRMDELFTPNGYRAVMRYRGREVRVRAPDGVHLSVAGTEIAAGEIVKALRSG